MESALSKEVRRYLSALDSPHTVATTTCTGPATTTCTVARDYDTMNWVFSEFEFEISVSKDKKCFQSPPFMFCYCEWNFILESSGWISLNLEHMYCSANIVQNIAFTFLLKNSDGILNIGVDGTNSFGVQSRIWKQKVWEPYNRSITFHRLLDTSLTVKCIMKNKNLKAETEASQSSKLNELKTLSSNFRDLLVSKANHDVTIKAKEKEFQAHRAVLVARSPVFAAMFEHDLAEKQTGVINIEDSDPDSFGEFLQYLYTGQLEDISSRSAYHLYVTSHKYHVKELKLFCVIHMNRNLTVENFCDVAIMADQYDEVLLVNSAQAFFNRNVCKILSTIEWETLIKNHFRLANKLFKNMASHAVTSPT